MLLALIITITLLIGLTLITLGLRGKQINNHPHCAKCNYDLVGHTNPTTCPECSASLNSKKAIRHGIRRWRKSPLRIGCVCLTIGLLPIGYSIFSAATGINWMQYAPTNWLINWMGDSPAAWAELSERFNTKKMDSEEISSLADRILVLLDQVGYYDEDRTRDWLLLYEESWRQGVLTPEQKTKYVTNWLEAQVRTPDYYYVSEHAPFRLIFGGEPNVRWDYSTPFAIRWDFQYQVNHGETIRPHYRNRLIHISEPQDLGGYFDLPTELGPYTFNAHFSYEIFEIDDWETLMAEQTFSAAAIAAGITPDPAPRVIPIAAVHQDFERTLEAVPRDLPFVTPPFVVDRIVQTTKPRYLRLHQDADLRLIQIKAEIATEMNNGIRIQTASGILEFSFQIERIDIPMCFDVILRTGSRTWTLLGGLTELSNVAYRGTIRHRAAMPVDENFNAETVEVILRPNSDLAARSAVGIAFGVTEIWGDEINLGKHKINWR